MMTIEKQQAGKWKTTLDLTTTHRKTLDRFARQASADLDTDVRRSDVVAACLALVLGDPVSDDRQRVAKWILKQE